MTNWFLLLTAPRDPVHLRETVSSHQRKSREADGEAAGYGTPLPDLHDALSGHLDSDDETVDMQVDQEKQVHVQYIERKNV